MARFIDAEKLEDRLLELIQRFPGNLTLPQILDMVEAMPEDIIRCKDCAEGGQTSLGFVCGSCIQQYGQMRFVNSNGYCSHANRKEEKGDYKSVGSIKESEEDMSALLEMARRELVAFEKKYAILRKELKSIFDAIDRLKE